MDREAKKLFQRYAGLISFSQSQFELKAIFLLIDEVLAVGDVAFQRKCLDYFEQLKKDGQTVILVSHDMSTVEKHCTRVLLINDGLALMEGDPKEAAAQYRLLNLESTERKEVAGPTLLANHVKIDEVTINGKHSVTVSQDMELSLLVRFTPKQAHKYIVSMSIVRGD